MAISSIYFVVALFASIFVVEAVLNYNRLLGILLILFIWCSPGYLTAAIAQRHVVLHASVAGALCCLLAIGATYAFEIGGFTDELGYRWFVAAVVSFGLGALVWCFKTWLVKGNA